MEYAKRCVVRAVFAALLAALVFSMAFGQAPASAPSPTTPPESSSDVYRFSKDFQAFFGALIGLLGVAATLLFNARKERVARETVERNDSQALAIALSTAHHEKLCKLA
jgi:hypothetical protein